MTAEAVQSVLLRMHFDSRFRARVMSGEARGLCSDVSPEEWKQLEALDPRAFLTDTNLLPRLEAAVCQEFPRTHAYVSFAEFCHSDEFAVALLPGGRTCAAFGAFAQRTIEKQAATPERALHGDVCRLETAIALLRRRAAAEREPAPSAGWRLGKRFACVHVGAGAIEYFSSTDLPFGENAAAPATQDTALLECRPDSSISVEKLSLALAALLVPAGTQVVPHADMLAAARAHGASDAEAVLAELLSDDVLERAS